MAHPDNVEIKKAEIANNGVEMPYGVDSMALEKLLQWDGDLIVTDVIHIDRLGIDVSIRSVPQEELETYNTMSETVTKNRATLAIERQTDNVKLGLLTVFHCVTDPDLSDSKLQGKHNSSKGKAREPYLIVSRIFLPGEAVMLSEAILALSGFTGGAYVAQSEMDENLSYNG